MLSLRLLAATCAIVLVAATAPGHAMLSMNAMNPNALNPNALNPNAVTQNAVTQNALATGGSAIADLNGVVVEAISLPHIIRP